MHAPNQNHHGLITGIRLDHLRGDFEGGTHFHVVLLHPREDPHHERHQDNGNPRAGGELRDGDNEKNHERDHRTDAVDHHAVFPTWFLQREVMAHHAGLAQRECGEHADGVERNEQRRDTAEHDDQHARRGGENEYAV